MSNNFRLFHQNLNLVDCYFHWVILFPYVVTNHKLNNIDLEKFMICYYSNNQHLTITKLQCKNKPKYLVKINIINSIYKVNDMVIIVSILKLLIPTVWSSFKKRCLNNIVKSS